MDRGYSHCSEGETEVQRGQVSSLELHSGEWRVEVVELG